LDDLYGEVPKSTLDTFKQLSSDLRKEKPTIEDKASIMMSKIDADELDASFEVMPEETKSAAVEDKKELPVTDSQFAAQLQEQMDASMMQSKAKADAARTRQDNMMTAYLKKVADLSEDKIKYRNQLMTFMQMDLLDFDKNLEALEKSNGSVANATGLLFSQIEQ